MPMKLYSTDDFRAAAKAGERPEGTVFRFSTAAPETVGEAASRTKRFVFSDATVDHSNDSIDPKGWDLGVFNRNPVALFSHMSWEPPIGRASNVAVHGGKLAGDIEFASADIYPFADTIYRLVDGGFLKAVSVGFLPKDWAFTSDKSRPYGIDYKKQLLAEISVCAVPCNPNSLMEARSAGVDTLPLVGWAERVLDNGDTAFLPRTELESLRTQAKGAAPVRYYIQADKDLTPQQAEVVRDMVKTWQATDDGVLVLPKGLTLRSAADGRQLADGGDVPHKAATETVIETLDIEIDQATITDIAAKAGRRISAANKTKLQAALDMSATHHDAMTACIKDVMDGDEQEPDDGDFDDNPPGPSDLPPGTVTPDKTLTPEEQRMAEARALRESLTPND